MADNFELKAIISAVDKLSGPLKGMSGNLKKFKKDAEDIAVKSIAMGAALTTAFALPIAKAIEFESTMADVKKVVDFDSQKQFSQMGEAILKLSTKLPMAADGIGKIVAAGGQAGIARGELSAFASDAVKMGIAFDQTAEESGQMMATWRTAFKMSQGEVVKLADKINYLGNTGPANAKKISEVVTRVGSIGKTAGLNSGEVAALGATITGVGVQADVASTGIKNLTKALTSGKALTRSQAAAFKKLGFNGTQIAKDMQRDASGTIIKVLSAVSKLSKETQSPALMTLFGSESSEAIFPLLTNLDLLKRNFERVSDAQKYAGSMQKEYASRSATTQNSIQLLKNQFDAASITIGSIFLPSIVELTKKVQPVIEQFRQYVKSNPDLIKNTFKFGISLLGVGVAVSTVSRTMSIFNSALKMSTMGRVFTLVAIAGTLIANNWETVGPVVKTVWRAVDNVVQSMGGWESVIASISALMVGDFAVKTIGSLSTALKKSNDLSGVLGKISKFGAMTLTVGVAVSLFKQLNELDDNAKSAGVSKGNYLVNKINASDEQRGYHGFLPRLRELLGLDQPTMVSGHTSSAGGRSQPTELTVRFDNAPPGMTVTSSSNSPQWPNVDVGYTWPRG